MAITRQELIKKYLDFFKSKNHKEIPNASLIPANDPTVLFTTAGMHPLVPYLTGQKHPLGNRLVNVQRCIRTGDIEEVGDEYHHTFFEMLGNWSLGDYWKKEAIPFTLEFVTKILKIPKEKLAVTCFGGDKKFPKIPKDKESESIWLSLGIPKERIASIPGGVLEKTDNWWGPAGENGPCGPCTEIFFWSDSKPAPKNFDTKDKRWIEIGNNVLMEYVKNEKDFVKAEQQNIDFGGGVERTLSAMNNQEDNYQSEVFLPIIKQIEKISHKNYESYKKEMRIIADHIKASVFIISDGITSSNTERGYILRRLIRRAIRYGKLLNIEINFTKKVAETIFPIYSGYHNLQKNKSKILEELEKEEIKFKKTVERGIRLFNKIANSARSPTISDKSTNSARSPTISDKSTNSARSPTISGKNAFLLFQSYGFPIEMTQEMAKEKKIKVDVKGFHESYKRHQTLSRTESAGKFKSGLADHSEITTRLHTATHLLNEALTRVLGEKAAQRGSNITQERTRFDFTFDRKLTEEEIKEIESLINKKIKSALSVVSEEIPLEKAFSSDAKGEFGHKYPDKVSVYTVIDKSDPRGFFSREICTGPHVKNTKEIGHFRIIEQDSVSAGVRRIKAKVE